MVKRKLAPKAKTSAQTKGGKNTQAQESKRMKEVLSRLEEAYPDSKCSLVFESPMQLAVATILSAQCTDVRVNKVTPELFERYPDAESLAGATLEDVEVLIRSTGFFRNKAKSITNCAKQVVEDHNGKLPQDLESLIKLAGIGRKTANVILGNAFDIPGLVVDTHVIRISNLLGLTSNKDPKKIEFDLMALVPKSKWSILAHLFIDHGRAVCVARRPQCEVCVLNTLCPSSHT